MTPRRCRTVLVAAALAGCAAGEPTAPAGPTGAVSADFEGGALAAWEHAEDGGFDVTLATAPGGHSHWYSFRILGRRGVETPVRFLNSQSADWESAWPVERPVVSEDDGATWQRIDRAAYSGFFFRFRYTPASDRSWIASTVPYDFSRWTARFAALKEHDLVSRAEVIGVSLEGRPVHHVVVGGGGDDPVPAIWVIARQHPDETPASWMLEGLLEWLLSGSPDAAALLSRVSVHLVPFMNPDGAVHGFQRVNTAGVDLNRQWDSPDPSVAPTVAAVQAAMEADAGGSGGVLLFVDLHGDPGGRWNYMFAQEHTEEARRASEAFMARMAAETALFSAAAGRFFQFVDVDHAQGWVTGRFGAPAYTLEASHNDVVYGPRGGTYMRVDDYEELGSALGPVLAAYAAETAATPPPPGTPPR